MPRSSVAPLDASMAGLVPGLTENSPIVEVFVTGAADLGSLRNQIADQRAKLVATELATNALMYVGAALVRMWAVPEGIVVDVTALPATERERFERFHDERGRGLSLVKANAVVLPQSTYQRALALVTKPQD